MTTPLGNHSEKRNQSSSSGVVASLRNIFSTTRETRTNTSQAEKLLSDSLQRMNKENPLEKRLAFTQEFCGFLDQYRIDRMYLERFWSEIKDLFDPSYPKPAKSAGLRIVRILAKSHSERLGTSMKADCWNIFLQQKKIDKEIIHTFDILTDSGRNIAPFEHEVGRIIVTWLKSIVGSHDNLASGALLTLLLGMVKFSFTAIPPREKEEIILLLCEVSDSATSFATIDLCLKCFDSILRYSTLPLSCLSSFISSLSRTVNMERFYDLSWQIVENTVQTHQAQCIYSLCFILDQKYHSEAINLLRGAIFFLGMSLWGSKRISTLSVSHLRILPSLSRVLDCQVAIIAYEVCLAIKRLIRKYGEELHLEWELIMAIFTKLRFYLTGSIPNSPKFAQILSETVESVFELASDRSFLGDRDRVYSTLTTFISILTERSITILLQYDIQYIHPLYPRWLLHLKKFAHYFYQLSHFRAPRLQALEELSLLFQTYKSLYSESMTKTLFSIFSETFARETDNLVHARALHFLGEIIPHAPSEVALKVLELMRTQANSNSAETALAAASILIRLFEQLWISPHYSKTIRLYQIVVDLLNHPLKRVRAKGLDTLTELRANQRCGILLHNTRSPFLQIDISRSSHHRTKRGKTGLLDLTLLLKVLLNRLLLETSFTLYIKSIHLIIIMLCNKFMVIGCDLQFFVTILHSEFEQSRIASTIKNPTLSKEAFVQCKVFHIFSLILFGYRWSLPRSQPFSLLELVASTSRYSPFPDVRNQCVKIISIACIDFPAGISYISSSFLEIIRIHKVNESALLGLLTYFVNAPTQLTRLLTQEDISTLISILLEITNFQTSAPLQINFLFRLFLQLLQRCDIKYRQNIYNTLTEQMKDLGIGAVEANLDLLSKYIFSNTIMESSDVSAENSMLFNRNMDSISHYLLGPVVLSIQLGNMNWIKTTIRRASGTITWISQVQNIISRRFERKNLPIDVFTPLRTYMDSISDITPRYIPHIPELEKGDSPTTFQKTPRVSLSPEIGQGSRRGSASTVSTLTIPGVPVASSDPIPFELPGEEENEEENFSPISFEFNSIFSPLDDHGPVEDIMRQTSSERIPLTNFYPPLPSYEEDLVSSPSFHAGTNFSLEPSPELVTENKLSEDGQLLLHTRSVSPISSETQDILHLSKDNLITPPLGAQILLQGSPIDSGPSSEIPFGKSPRGPNPLSISVSLSEPSLVIGRTRSKTAPIINRSPSNTSAIPTSPFKVPPDNLVSEKERDAETDTAIHPSFIFLQMQQIPFLSNDAQLLEDSDETLRSVKLLDLTNPRDTFKFGICYVRSDQTTEEDIFQNICGSQSYDNFLKSMGKLIRLKETPLYSGGLDRVNDSDGKWTLHFQDEVLEIVYHVATMMENQRGEGLRHIDLKKRHIGNNFVNIVFSEQEKDFDIHTFSGQFNHVNIIVKPLEDDLFLLDVKSKEIPLDFIPFVYPLVVSSEAIPVLLRETCVLAAITCRVTLKRSQNSNRLERLKFIQQLSAYQTSHLPRVHHSQ